MKLRNLFLIPAVCAALTLALGACSDDKAKNAEEKAEEKSEEKTEAKNETSVLTFDLNGVELKMIRVKAGTFQMGSENGDDREKPVHQVTLTKDYYLGQYEVTQAQYQAVIGKNPSYFKGDNRPVECVSWEDAMEFCKKLNESGKAPTGWKFTLPTEAQWEFACRAGTTTNFSYGDASDTSKMNFDGNYPCGGGSKGVDRRETVEVGSLRYKNNWGFYDMHGNVEEWCLDWCGNSYYRNGAATDPQGPENGSYRVLRGGCWYDNARFCRTAFRSSNYPGYRYNREGFRVALVQE